MLIGLLGRSRVGKDTVALGLKTYFNDAQIIRLSTPLKEAVCALYAFTPEQVEGPDKEVVDMRYGFTPRIAIQSLCKYMMDLNGETFFTKQCYQKIDSSQRTFIIPDVRYSHDIDEIHKRNGIVIKVTRPSNCPVHQWEDKISELVGDYEIVNDGSIEDLHKKCSLLCGEITGKVK